MRNVNGKLIKISSHKLPLLVNLKKNKQIKNYYKGFYLKS